MGTESTVKVCVMHRLEFPPERVFDAWLDAQQAAKWLFATPTGTMVKAQSDPRVGGRYVFVDRRDGEDVEHMGEYLVIERPRRLVFTFSVPKFSKDPTRVSIEIVPRGNGCELTLTHEGVLPEYADRTQGGWSKILGGLETALKDNTKPAFELELTRVIDAPRVRVYEAWTKPEQMAQWFAPKPYQLIIHMMDFRPGGRFSMAMRGPDGQDFPFTGTYHEIVPPTLLSWTGEFASGPADQVSTVVTFEEQGQQTKVHVRQTFHVMTPEIEHATKGAKQGWTMTLDQLAAFCSREKRP